MSAAAAGLLAGLLLGAVFFGGLRWTVERLPTARHPGLLVGLSLALRLAFLGTGLVVLLRWWGWVAGVAALAGILTARTVVVRRAAGMAGGGGVTADGAAAGVVDGPGIADRAADGVADATAGASPAPSTGAGSRAVVDRPAAPRDAGGARWS